MDELLLGKLFESAKTGDRSAIYELYAATRDYAWFVAGLYLKNDKDAAYALKEAYIGAFGRFNDIPMGQTFIGWLNWAIAIKCLNLMRGKKASYGSKNGVMPLPDSEEIFPPEWLEDGQKRADALRMADALPEPQRVAVLLCYANGLSAIEISACMGIPPELAEGYLRTGKAALRAGSGARDKASQGGPVLTRMILLQAEGRAMPSDLAKSIYQEMMMFFMEGGKAGRLVAAPGGSSGGGGSDEKSRGNYIPWVVSFAAVALAILFMFINFGSKQKKLGKELVEKYNLAREAELAEESAYMQSAAQATPPKAPGSKVSGVVNLDDSDGDSSGEESSSGAEDMPDDLD